MIKYFLRMVEFLCWWILKGLLGALPFYPSCFYAPWISQSLTGLPQSWPVLQVAMIPRPARQRGTDMLNTALIYYGRHNAHIHTQCLTWLCVKIRGSGVIRRAERPLRGLKYTFWSFFDFLPFSVQTSETNVGLLVSELPFKKSIFSTAN